MSKRRRAREMAVQMLYQGDLGGSAWRDIFSSFDPWSSVDAGDGSGGKGKAGAKAGARVLARIEGERLRDEVHDAFEYAKTLVLGTVEHLEAIDELIRSQAENWRLERMPAVDRNILRLAVYELMYEAEVPKLVVIDEAIELAKRYGSERSSRFVNGLLDGILRSHSFPGSLQ